MKNLFLVLILAFFMSGCSLFEDSDQQMNKNAEQLAAEGAEEFLDENYKEAIKAYTDLKDWYPFSKYAILAELKIADSHFHLEEYAEAIASYENFEKLHPRNEAVPYIINQIGLCWFNQIKSTDRDASPARNAKEQFQRLLDQYPDNAEYGEKARENIQKCIDDMAAHELYVADFYLKTKKYKSALKRYEYIVETYPGSDQGEAAAKKIPECTSLAAEQELAKKEEK